MKSIINKQDTRINATAIIWGCTTGMMAILKQSSIILPLAVIVGATISTVAIWRNNKKQYFESSNDFKQIKQRISDLETICINQK